MTPCKASSLEQCATRAKQLYEGSHGKRRDRARALTLFEHACVAEHASSCTAAGRMWHKGQGVKKPDTQKSFKSFERACAKGHMPGCHELATILITRKAYDKAIKILEASCAKNHTGSCVTLGIQLQDKDPERARSLLKHICFKGKRATHAIACNALATKTTDNNASAVMLYQRACRIGLPDSCLTFAKMLRDGRGVASNPKEAAHYFVSLCQANIPHACALAAPMFLKGLGVKVSTSRAASMHRQACEGRIYSSCKALALAYAKGSGVVQEMESARAFASHACIHGVKTSCTHSKVFLNKLLKASLKASSRNLSQKSTLSKELIRTVVRQNISLVRSCYETHIHQKPKAKGVVRMRFVIGHDGQVLESTVLQDTLDISDVSSCMTKLIKDWKFAHTFVPKGAKSPSVAVHYPFHFSPK